MRCSARVWRGASRGRINAIKRRNELGRRPDSRVIARVSQQMDSGCRATYFLKDSSQWKKIRLGQT